MSEEFDKLKQAFSTQAETKPRANARANALAKAMQNFEEEKKSTASQGMADEARLTNQKQRKSFLSNWRNKMNTINSKFAYSLMGGASVAVLAFVVVAPNLINETSVPEFKSKPKASNELALKDALEERVAESQITLDQETDAAVSSPAPVKRERKLSAVKKQIGQAAPSPSVSKQFRADQSAGVQGQSLGRIMPQPEIIAPQVTSRDKFEKVAQNDVKTVANDPVSTFSVDVDTASYSFMRSSLNNNVLPSSDSIRVEELINYFSYNYEVPADKSEPFKANVQIMPTPWNEGTKLMSIGIKGYELAQTEQPSSNLVFLIDTSGSMNQANKLPLLRSSFKLLLDTLKPTDTVSIVTYAGSAGTVLEPTKTSNRSKIMGALNRLSAGGSTAGAAGIRQAYALAEQNLDEEGVNRVILATDGDFNVGISDPEQLKTYISKKRDTGVSLSVLGFGRGNYNDHLMQKLAQNGNGNAAYIDTLSEARKVLVEQSGSTLFTIAKDVKLQIEFNPSLVSEYRLIGYETRALKREDFNNDKIDAGDIGAGHTVTALYEITPAGSSSQSVDPLRYGNEEVAKPAPTGNSSEYGFLKIRHKLPDSDKSTLITTPITKANEVRSVGAASQDSQFAASVAAFGQLLKGGKYTGSYSYDDVIRLAQNSKGRDEFGYRAEFINLVRSAESISKLQ